jgi:eukaryotic-like serine/threonine-protein kinase
MTGTVPPVQPMAGPTVLDGRYRLIAPIATGGMSVVWRGYDDVLARPIAVKLMAVNSGVFADRVRREAMAIARITHPYIANVYDYGESVDRDGSVVPYIVMELVEGSSLAEVLARGPLSWPTAAGIGAQVAAALSAAHQYGVVHRDVTPANIMLCVDGVKVVDFGISAPAGEAADALIFGTPAYLAPERLSGGPTLAATDVYGLGLVIYQMVAGRLPWPSETTTQMLTAHQYVPPAPLPPIPGMPTQLATLCQRALAVDPASRPTSADLSAELAAMARAGDPRARPGLIGAAVPPVEVADADLRSPTGTRVLSRGFVAGAAPSTEPMHGLPVRPAVPTRPAPTARGRRPRNQGMFALPAVLLAVLVGGLAWASLHQADATATAPPPTPAVTATHAAAAPKHTRKAVVPISCRVNYEMSSQWVLGFSAQVTVVNTGTSAINGWTLRFDLQPGQSVGGGWNGTWRQSGQSVTVDGASYNSSLPVGGSVTVGFIGAEHGNNSTTPPRFTLNGSSCDIE